jgi:uncharacterized protein (TIGR00369 family)
MSEERSNLSGLQQVNTLLSRGLQPPFGRKLGISLVEAAEGHAVFMGKPSEADYNPMGTVHGGYVAAILDSACGIAVHTGLMPGQTYATAEIKVTFLRPLSQRSGAVRAIGKLLQIGKRTAFAEASLHDQAGQLCATASATLIVFPAPANS